MTKRNIFTTALALLLLLGPLGCANEVDDGKDSDTVIRVETIEPAIITSCTEPFTVTVGGIPRGGAGDSPLNDVVLERYQLNFSAQLGGGTTGPIDITVLVPSNGTGSFDAYLFLGAGAGNATLRVEGRDTLGNYASAEAQVHVNCL